MADSDSKLTGEKAYNLYHEKGYTQKQIGEKFNVSQSYVSQLINTYDEALDKGKEQGKEQVDPTDFDPDTLENALKDKKSKEDEYNCGTCGAEVQYLDPECPECENTLQWGAL